MKTNKYLIMAAMVTSLAFATTVQASPITGTIGISGAFTTDNANLSLATTFTTTTDGVGLTMDLTHADGAFATGTLTQGLYSPIGVNGSVGNLVGNKLWVVTVGTTVYSFWVTGETQGATVITTATSLGLSGTGIVMDNISGADNTAGTWQLAFGQTTAGQTASFTWQATSGANGVGVPDGGATVMLLGAALSAMGLFRKKLFA